MSMDLTAKALKTKVGSAATKLVLVCMADIANNEGTCFPSYQYIADLCEMSKRSVIEHLKKLEQLGIVTKHERKTPKGNSSNIYKITIKGSEKSAPPSANGSPPGEIPAPPPSENPAPRTNHSFEPINEPEEINTQALNLLSKKYEFDFPEWIDAEAMSEWLDYRSKKKGTNSPRAINALVKDLAEMRSAGISSTDAIDTAIKKGWLTVELSYLKNHRGHSHGTSGSEAISGKPTGAAARVSQRNQRAYQEAIAREQGDPTVREVSGEIYAQVDFGD